MDGGGVIFSAVLVYIGFSLLNNNNKSMLLLFVLTLPLSIYFPTGITYGYPSVEVIFSILNTNAMEIVGYVKAVSDKSICTFLYIVGFIVLLKKKKILEWSFIKGCIGLLFISFSLIVTPSGITDGFIPSLFRSIDYVLNYKYELNRNQDGVVSKGIEKDDLKILIVGESVRKDYMSCYGYQLETTPFLNKANGIFFDNYISPAPNTRLALQFSFFKKASRNTAALEYDKNIINIARAAGYHVTWISNQGRSGFGDDLIYDLAGLADERIFLKNKEFNKEDYDDMELISLLKNKIRGNSKQLVVLHMIGSHEPVCSRAKNFDKFGHRNDLECYTTSIYKLDTFIDKVWEIAKYNNKKSQIMYFSDHGLSVSENRAFHDVDLVEQYNVPLFIINNSDKKIRVPEAISGFQFIDIFSSWLDCEVEWLSSSIDINNIDKFKSNDLLVYFNGYKSYNSLKKSQKAYYPENNDNIDGMEILSDSCRGNIDSQRNGYVNGWLACTSNDIWVSCNKVGVFSVDSNNIVDYMIGTPVIRHDVNAHLNSSSTNKFGFDVFVRNPDREYYIGYINPDDNKVVVCNNLKISN